MVATDIAQNHPFTDEILMGVFLLMLCIYSLEMLKPTFFIKYMVILNGDNLKDQSKKY